MGAGLRFSLNDNKQIGEIMKAIMTLIGVLMTVSSPAWAKVALHCGENRNGTIVTVSDEGGGVYEATVISHNPALKGKGPWIFPNLEETKDGFSGPGFTVSIANPDFEFIQIPSLGKHAEPISCDKL
jgi:hypothetical protein